LKKKKIKVEVKEGKIIFEVPILKPRNPLKVKPLQKHEDKRKKEKHKKEFKEILEES
jgi:hypothetical protein